MTAMNCNSPSMRELLPHELEAISGAFGEGHFQVNYALAAVGLAAATTLGVLAAIPTGGTSLIVAGAAVGALATGIAGADAFF